MRLVCVLVNFLKYHKHVPPTQKTSSTLPQPQSNCEHVNNEQDTRREHTHTAECVCVCMNISATHTHTKSVSIFIQEAPSPPIWRLRRIALLLNMHVGSLSTISRWFWRWDWCCYGDGLIWSGKCTNCRPCDSKWWWLNSAFGGKTLKSECRYSNWKVALRYYA